MHNGKLEVIILAAGQGTRMRSALPKVLHVIGDRPLLAHVIATAEQLNPVAIHVVYGHGGEQVRAQLNQVAVNWVEQAEQLGTGHAVAQALPAVDPESTVLILYGDVPLVRRETLAGLVAAAVARGFALLTVKLDDPTGYGRIVRDASGEVKRIVEQKDADAQTLAICEGNSGMMALSGRHLSGWLARLDNDNSQGEYYLTDVIAMAVAEGACVEGIVANDVDEVLGVNDRLQLAHLERALQRRNAEALMRAGVTLIDPQRFDLRGTVECGQDVVLDVGVILEGEVRLGDRVRIGANTILRNVTIGSDSEVLPMSLLEQAEVGQRCTIGPFARLRPATVLGDGAKVGNFVEIKKSTIGAGSKVNHLSYIGDTEMGSGVNVGAGAITCNYDGANKHRTVIGDGAFIGSDSQLVAPVVVGAGATIGAGSTITKDTPEQTLSLSRSRQLSIRGWKRPVKK